MNKPMNVGLLSLATLTILAPACCAQSFGNFGFTDSALINVGTSIGGALTPSAPTTAPNLAPFTRAAGQVNMAPAGGQAAGEAGGGRMMTGGSGSTGSEWNNLPSNDAEMTRRGAFPFLIGPNDTARTVQSNATHQHAYQALAPQRTRTGLLAPISTLQFSDTFPFGSQFDLGFPGPSGPTWAGRGWNAGVPLFPIMTPTVGTGSADLDVTIDGGY